MSKATMTHFECVGEFHDTFGHPIRSKPYTKCFKDEPKLVPFRLSLMNEELKEFKEAYNNHDIFEMADALADLSYVTLGTGHALGINLDKTLQSLNLSIMSQKKITPRKRSIFKSKMICEYVDDLYEIIKSNMSLLGFYTKLKDLNVIATYLAYILFFTYKLGHYLKFQMDEIFREVHRSNMTKVCDNIDDAKESIKRYTEEGRYSEPKYRKKDNYYVIYDNATSKILKNYKWETPNIKQFFE